MIALLQRVDEARVEVDGAVAGSIGRGLMVLVCAERHDDDAQADRLCARLLSYRVFPDERGRMNRSLRDLAVDAAAPPAGGDGSGPDGADATPAGAVRRRAGLLLVPQFTLAADTRGGTRPGFSPAAEPAAGRRLFERFVAAARAAHADVQTGVFGAHMRVHLVNDGPVTFWLREDPPRPAGA